MRGEKATRSASALVWAFFGGMAGACVLGCAGDPGGDAPRADAGPDGADVRGDVPLPGVPPNARRILPPGFRMEGLSPRAMCSHGPASGIGGEHWCVVSRVVRGRTQLFALEATRASGSSEVSGNLRCDGSNPDCILVDADVFDSKTSRETTDAGLHGFHGDTLIYYGPKRSASWEDYRGQIFAWRPGWSAGRPLTSEQGTSCQVHSSAAVVVCVEDDGPAADGSRRGRYHAGRIDQAPLPRLFPESMESNVKSSDFSSDGAHFIYTLAPGESWAARCGGSRPPTSARPPPGW